VGYNIRKSELIASWIIEFTNSVLKSELGKFCLNVNFPKMRNADTHENLNVKNIFNGTRFTLLSGYHHGDVFNEVGAGESPKVRQFSFARNHKIADQPEEMFLSEYPDILFDQEAIHQGFVSVTPLTDILLNKEMIKKLKRNSSNFENL
jgi:broad specificity polyphosphatase/5'/3'-nucleotidase SurE